jgi:hypothetical protein
VSAAGSDWIDGGAFRGEPGASPGEPGPGWVRGQREKLLDFVDPSGTHYPRKMDTPQKVVIVVPTIRENNMNDFLAAWAGEFKNATIVVVQDNAERTFDISGIISKGTFHDA